MNLLQKLEFYTFSHKILLIVKLDKWEEING